MTRIFTTGFEEGFHEYIFDGMSGDDPSYIGVFTGRMQHDSVLGTVYPRSGNRAFFLNGNWNVHKDIPNITDAYLGIAFRIAGGSGDGGSTWLGLQTTAASSEVGIRLMSTTSLGFYRGGTQLGTATGLTGLFGAWHYLEWYVLPRNSGGVYTVKLDGTQIFTYSGDTTDSNEYFQRLQIFARSSNCQYDDIVLNNSSGSYNNTWPGQVRLLPLLPTGAGSTTQWSRAGFDTGVNHGQVLVPDGNGFTVAQVTSADQIDLFDVGTPDLPAGATIKNVITSVIARQDTGGGSLAAVVRGDSTNELGSTVALTSSWKNIQHCAPINPADSAAWEEADLANLQIGYSSK